MPPSSFFGPFLVDAFVLVVCLERGSRFQDYVYFVFYDMIVGPASH
jgi:hypothetical protein